MRELGYDQVHRDAMHNVVGIIKGSGRGPSLMFNGHIDHAGVGSMDRSLCRRGDRRRAELAARAR